MGKRGLELMTIFTEITTNGMENKAIEKINKLMRKNEYKYFYSTRKIKYKDHLRSKTNYKRYIFVDTDTDDEGNVLGYVVFSDTTFGNA